MESHPTRTRRGDESEASRCFGFGITEHIGLGARYDPNIGIFGMDFYIVMGRPGARVARRKAKKARIGFQHRVKKEDTMAWFKQRFDGIILVRLTPYFHFNITNCILSPEINVHFCSLSLWSPLLLCNIAIYSHDPYFFISPLLCDFL